MRRLDRPAGWGNGSYQASRFELKYVVDEITARDIRDAVRAYLQPDSYFDPKSPFGYPVRSLYLDSRCLNLCRQTTEGLRNRFKLRVRFYSEAPHAPTFLEIKRRVHDTILKDRAAISREGAGQVLTGYWPQNSELLDAQLDPGSVDTLHQFCTLRDSIGALGSVFVSYYREAYVCDDSRGAVRVTFDRLVEGGDYQWGDALMLPRDTKPAGIDGVILEIKYTDRCPRWLLGLIQAYDLQRQSVPKYVKSVSAVRPNLF